MKKLSLKLLADTVASARKTQKITQAQLSERTGINRALLSRLESEEFTPSVDQLLALSSVLNFKMDDLFVDTYAEDISTNEHSYRIAVAGTGYVGLSLAVLLSQHNQVTAVDIIPEKVEKINNYVSPIQDEYIEKYLSEAKQGKRILNLKARSRSML